MDQNDSELESESEEEEVVVVVKGKGKGRAITGKGKTIKGDKKEVKRRSSKACDNCRKSKCKCTRDVEGLNNEPAAKCHNCITTGSNCTYFGESRKRGPPKGYIEAIESRLNRMESLMGTLLSSDDPRAQILLGELIGNEEAREVLASDLKSAAVYTSQQRRSWQSVDPTASHNTSRPQVAQGFHVPESFGQDFSSGASSQSPMPQTWYTEEELKMVPPQDIPHGIFSNTDGFDTVTAFSRSGESLSATTSSLFAVDIPVGVSVGGTMNPKDSITKSRSDSLSLSTPGDSTSSPRLQRRKLNAPNPTILPPSASSSYLTSAGHPSNGGFIGASTSPAVLNPTTSIGSLAFQAQSKSKSLPPPNAIAHTGQSSYVLTAEAELSHAELGDGSGTGGGADMTELADVVGQLSLNENAEVRYHGRSSGLYLISKSRRYKDFFWQFPSAGVWPPTDNRTVKTEQEILGVENLGDALPDRATQQHLLDLYWTYVHPHFPILYKVSFMRQYRHSESNPNSTDPSTPSGGGKVPIVLLLSMFSLAARYSNLPPDPEDGDYWSSGTGFAEQAKKVLDYDYGSSKLVTVQALLLMSYREIGAGGMSSSWILVGMAAKMAQDLGLFRDVEKWFLPVHKFSHEEKQSRKRVWWACVILDRYTASYIGRPGTIHERDYDVTFPSEDEPDEHEQWRPIRPDGTDYSVAPKFPQEDDRSILPRYTPVKAHTMSCFSAAGALAVLINRIIANIYAIRTRVLGQSSETLLTLLDQSLASWYIGLPPHLVYTPKSKKVPPPHVLSLHLQFYSALILLHRPFIPGQNSNSGGSTTFPSHSICTTSANAISNIVNTFSKTFTLRQCPPFLTYPIFSACVMFVYNAGFDESLAIQAKVHLKSCMEALSEMEIIWGSAMRQRELLTGLVDLRDVDLGAEHGSEANRRQKRPAEMDSTSTPIASGSTDFRPANFQSRPAGRANSLSASSSKPRRRSTSSLFRAEVQATASQSIGIPSPSIPETAFYVPDSLPLASNLPANMDDIFNFSLQGADTTHQSFDILNSAGGNIDISQFVPPGAAVNYTELLNSFLAPSSSHNNSNFNLEDGMDSEGAFFNLPLGSDLTDEWRSFLNAGSHQADPSVSTDSDTHNDFNSL